MKYIKKEPAPAALIQYRRTPGASYEDMVQNHRPIYEETKQKLAKEQGYICCYCGQKITGLQGTQIEHVFAKGTAAYAQMQLSYETNLIACCDGGKDERRRNSQIPANHLHCDTKKAQEPIPVTPLNPLCEDKFLYDATGDVFGVEADAEATIEILNLQSPILISKRKAAIDAYSFLPPTDWKKEYDRLANKNSHGEYSEFCFVLQKYIEFFQLNVV